MTIGVVGVERVEQGGDVLAERHGVEAAVGRRATSARSRA